MRSVFMLALAALAAPLAVGQAKPPVAWQVKTAPHGPVKPGAKFDITIAGQIRPGWHVYALEEPDGGPIATQVALAEGDPADLLRVTGTKPQMVQDPAFGMQTGLYNNTVAFTLHLQAPKQPGSPGEHPLHVLVRYQSCDNQICLPPHTDTIEVPLAVAR